ncbi:MAG TPA: C25 family cysteine peptidase [Edaphocola sp.]|nr:C25 family cysteine peptidase [Edaphocola sp.]
MNRKKFLAKRISRGSQMILQLIGIFVLISYTGQKVNGQNLLGNEWINFNQSYFKIKVGKSGIYRIPYSLLQSNGMGAITGNQFTLIREGEEIPIYLSNNGTLNSSDYIEFYGKIANGKMDQELYTPVGRQGNPNVNIISDTAIYFLSYNSSPHSRLNLKSNSTPSNPPTAEDYCITKVYPDENIRNGFSNGESYYLGTTEPIQYQSGKFDKGEGYAYTGNGEVYLNFKTPHRSPIINTELSFATLMNSKLNNLTLGVMMNTIWLWDTAVNSFSLVNKTRSNINPFYLADTILLKFYADVRINILKAEISYNRTFDFAGVDHLAFSLENFNQTQKLSISNLNAANPNLLVDLSTKNIYHLGSNSDVFLDPSITKRDVIFSANPIIISKLNPITFRDYSNTANQGNYIILSDDEYINIPNGGINQYKNYRSSNDGGDFNVVVISANELYNQFAYGMDYHPLAIKHFIKYTQQNASWIQKPEHLFIIGKGLTYNYIDNYKKQRNTLTFPAIPTFGNPGSDFLFVENDNASNPSIAVGRLSAMSNNEILAYLTKVKLYENAQKEPPIPNLENSLWKKRALHIAGGTDINLQSLFLSSLNTCKSIIEDTLTGAIVSTVSKNTTSITENASSQIDSIISHGIQYITFYGHASASIFDYNLNNPEDIHSTPKFPIFMAYGCDVAAIFEPTVYKTISERYLNEANGGAIAMLACTTYGWTGYLEPYMQELYRVIAQQKYGKTFGEQLKTTLNNYGASTPNNIYFQTHKQTFTLQGDPGLKISNPEKADYYIDESLISSNPAVINTSIDSFEIKAKVYNLGKAIKDSIWVRITKTKVGSNNILSKDSVRIKLLNEKELTFKLPLDSKNDIGLFNYSISLNDEQLPDETSFLNNKASLQLYIAEDNIIPIYPYEFSIVHEQGISLKASTLNPFLKPKKYLLEIDTTEYFNSSFKHTENINSSGGLVKWKVPFQMTDSTVYYWRVATDTLINGSIPWYNSSFVFLKNGSEGWNQSHFFQYKKDQEILLENKEPSRIFHGQSYNLNLNINTKFWPSGNGNVYLGDDRIARGSCLPAGKSGLMFVVINPDTRKPLQNLSQFPGAFPDCGSRPNQFEFYVNNAAQRKQVMDFIDSIPENYYVVFKSNGYLVNGDTITSSQDWLADDVNGNGQSLYQYLINLGFPNISNLNTQKPFVGVAQKGNLNFPAELIFDNDSSQIVTLDVALPFNLPSGSLISTIIGPVKKWDQLLWQTKTLNNDTTAKKTSVTVYGLMSPDAIQMDSLFTTGNRDTSLSTIDVNQYPYLQLKWYAEDSVNFTLPQLKYWRVMYQPLPEAALNPNAGMVFKDTFSQGEILSLKLPIENLREIPMDSMLVRFKLTDAGNTSKTLGSFRFKSLPGNDTIMVTLENIDTKPYPGNNYLFIEANPDNDQPEYYHPNNLGYLKFYVKPDQLSPITDVTFDGVHILNNDIVSAKPFINILIRDENKQSPIKDTANILVKLQNNETGIKENVFFDGSRCKFIPATLNGKNEAHVEFRPELEDGNYTLSVQGKDNVGNQLGSSNNTNTYQISFEVINKSTITHVLNYPNPFSTSTQFLFTLTGSEIPSQFKIQIISVTGKVVKEITKAELGNIHIGRNISSYKWDGTDQYGQLLGNGVYLYRVITTNKNGDAIEKKINSNLEKYFKNEYGKLYIMR